MNQKFQNFINRAPINFIFNCQLVVRSAVSMILPNGRNGLITQIFSLSIFRNLIRNVFSICSKPKMIWITANSHIARMANMFPFRDQSISKLICQTMNTVEPTLKSHLGISCSVNTATNPRPTFLAGRFLNSPPKVLNVAVTIRSDVSRFTSWHSRILSLAVIP